jgi:hypothetical protein
MDAHSETNDVIESQDPISTLPDFQGEDNSFEASLERAFAKLDVASNEPESKAEATQRTAEPTTKQTADSPKAEKVDSYSDPIEELSDDVGNDWTPEAARRFKQLKQELKQNRSQLQELEQAKIQYEAKIQELAGLAENKDVEELQQRLAEYEQRQMFVDLEQTTVYQKVVAEPLRELLGQANQIADKYDVDTSSLIDVLSMTDADLQEEKLAELLPRASDRDKAKIYSIMERIEPIIQKRAEMMTNTQQAMAEARLAEEQQQRAEMAERARMRTAITHNVVERIQQKVPFISSIQGLDLARIEQESAAIDPSTLHSVDHAFNAVSAKLLPNIIREYVSLRKEFDSITDRLADYEQAEPKMSGSSPSPSKQSQAAGSFIDRVNSALTGTM